MAAASRQLKVTVNGRCFEVTLLPDAVVVDGTTLKTTVLRDNGDATVRVAGRPYKVKPKDDKTVIVDGRSFAVEMSGRAVPNRQPAQVAKSPAGKGPAGCAEKGAVRALMPGTVLAVRVQEGQPVAAGAVLLVIETMKMENEIKAPQEGVVKRIAIAPGQTVSNGDVMMVIE